MNSEGKIFAPKPIRKCATAITLKHSKSIGYPNSGAKHNNKNNSKANQNDLFDELASDLIPKKPSNWSSPEDKVSFGSEKELETNKFVSYKQFQSEIDNEFAKQVATFEILSILSNSKNSHRESNFQSNFNSDFNKLSANNSNKIVNDNGSFSEFDIDYFQDGKQERLNTCGYNQGKGLEKEKEEAKCSHAKDNKLDKLAYNSIDCKEANLSLIDNASNEPNNSNQVKNENKELLNFNKILNCLDEENEEWFKHENLKHTNNLFLSDKSDIRTNSKNNHQNQRKLAALIINEAPVTTLKSKFYSLEINSKNDFAIKNFLNKTPFKVSQNEKSAYSININEQSSKEKQIKEKKDPLTVNSHEANYNNHNFLKDNGSNTTNYHDNILYFVEENFFLELQNEKLENFSFTTSLDKSNKRLNTQGIPKDLFKASVPIRCKNPFLQSLKNEGLNKINKFFNYEQTLKDDNLPYNSYEEPFENYSFSKKAKFQSENKKKCKI